jgi:curved DNA-binding protein CbpA
MTSPTFSPDWIKQFADPYAVLGVSVAADERRIAKRYRQIAKHLHPDQQIGAEDDVREFANQILTRLVNPSYQRLKQDKGRAETLATLRFKVRRLSREDKLSTESALSKKLLEVDESQVEVLYEQALTDLSDTQYVSAESFEQQTAAIAELNLVYLRRKMGDPVIREKRTGLMSANPVESTFASSPTAEPPAPKKESSSVDYAQRHVARAKTYIASKCYNDAIQELRDAVRIEPNNSNYHSMLGQAYLLQKMTGMAKVHFRQALKLDPNNAIARKYAQQLEIKENAPAQANDSRNGNGHSKAKAGGLFGLFGRKRATK